ncbi:MAG: hypothetical protein KQI81_09050 [Deltaproteobacteria bacterium]|nr:hypothetical protein [Deltaproteobacteria bacterium]
MSWETALIGTILSDPASYHEAGHLLPSDFNGANQIIWAEIISMVQQDSNIDNRTIVENLRRSPDWQRMADNDTPENYIARLIQDRGTNVKNYAHEVLAASTRRAMKRNAALIAAAAEDENRQLEEILDYAENQIMRLRRSRADNGYTLGDLFALFMPRFQAQLDGTFVPAWKPQVEVVRSMMKYAEDSETIIIAARPGNGKSSYIRFEFLKAAMGNPELNLTPKKPVIFNLDNDKLDYPRNLLALYTGIDNQKIKEPRLLSSRELQMINKGAKYLSSVPLRIEEASGWTAAMIVRRALELRQKGELDIMAVDYIQQVRNGIANRNEDVGTTISLIRAFGMTHGVPQFVASQMSRAVEQRGNDNGPLLSDLRDSGVLEQDGSIIMFPRVSWDRQPTIAQVSRWRKNLDARGNPLENPIVVPVRFHFEKNRNGPIGLSPEVAWDKSTGNYEAVPA